MIRWIERSPYLHEARMTTADGADLYAGYIAVTPGAAVWRGYVGRGFSPLGIGPRGVMQHLVEQRVAEIMQRGGIGQQLAAFVDGDDQRDSG